MATMMILFFASFVLLWCGNLISQSKAFTPTFTRQHFPTTKTLNNEDNNGISKREEFLEPRGQKRQQSSLLAKVKLPSQTDEDTMFRSPSVLICGGGPTGLLCAIMLAQKYDFPIDVYDERPMPPSPTDERVWGDIGSHYLIGLGGRGITSLQDFGVWDEVAAVSTLVPGRKEWMSKKLEGNEIILTGERKYATHVLARDRLVSVLHNHVVEKYSDQIQLHYGHYVRPVAFEEKQVLVEIARVNTTDSNNKNIVDNDSSPDTVWEPVSTRFLVAADGSARTFANRMEEDDMKEQVENPFRVIRYEDDNPRVFKTIPFTVPAHWRKDLNYAVRSEDGRVNFDALPADGKGAYIGTLLLRGNDEMAQPNLDPTKFGRFLDEYLPQFSARFDDEIIEKVALAPPSNLPTFRYVAPRLQHKKRTVLLGDCAHTVKPYFGMGANSALEDVKILGQCVDSNGPSFESAISAFSDTRASDIATLVQISHSLDRPGTLGTIRFLVPIILDGIFSKLFPSLFEPNIIRMIQSEEITFEQAASRKKLDRVRQMGLLGTGLAGVVSGVKQFIIGQVAGFMLWPTAYQKALSIIISSDDQ